MNHRPPAGLVRRSLRKYPDIGPVISRIGLQPREHQESGAGLRTCAEDRSRSTDTGKTAEVGNYVFP